eukprot:gene4731-6638_t
MTEKELPKRSIPWVEKYRPDTVDDISHQDEVVSTLKKSIQLGSLPHLLFHGPPGTGKTTTILAVARALYGPELYKSRILELNASDERGIKVVREKIKSFAQGAVGGKKTSGYPCPRFKLIILDEADTMTPEAQSALRRVIEAYSKVTRFCLICNYVTRVIEPLASRCAKFRFKPLPAEAMQARLLDIAAKENIQLADKSALDALMKVSYGDMRKAVTFLQTSHQLSMGGIINADIVTDVSGQVPNTIMNELWSKMSGNGFDAMQLSVSDICYQGYPMAAVLAQLHDDVIVSTQLSDVDKALICEKICQAEQSLIDGATESIQLLDVAAFVMRRVTRFAAEVDTINSPH